MKVDVTSIVPLVVYLASSIHIFIHEHIIVQTLGLERKDYADRGLLSTSNDCSLEAFQRGSIHFSGFGFGKAKTLMPAVSY